MKFLRGRSNPVSSLKTTKVSPFKALGGGFKQNLNTPISNQRISDMQELMRIAESKDELRDIAKKNRDGKSQIPTDSNEDSSRQFGEAGLGVISIDKLDSERLERRQIISKSKFLSPSQKQRDVESIGQDIISIHRYSNRSPVGQETQYRITG